MLQTRVSLPDFSIKMDVIEQGFDQLLEANREIIAQLELLTSPNWKNFAMPMQAMDMTLEDFWSPIGDLNGVKNSDELRDVYQACIAKLTAYGTELGQNEALFTT